MIHVLNGTTRNGNDPFRKKTLHGSDMFGIIAEIAIQQRFWKLNNHEACVLRSVYHDSPFFWGLHYTFTLILNITHGGEGKGLQNIHSKETFFIILQVYFSVKNNLGQLLAW